MSHRFKRYYAAEDELANFLATLKVLRCPHCKMVGALILHGFLYGYEESSVSSKEVRGRRVICNARRRRNTGCGHTFSILASGMLKNFCITAASLWTFLINVLQGMNKTRAFQKLETTLSPSSAYRLWRRFSHAQSRIRSYLTRHCPRPKLPATPCPATQTIAQVKSVFTGALCPIAAFQERFGVSFL